MPPMKNARAADLVSMTGAEHAPDQAFEQHHLHEFARYTAAVFTCRPHNVHQPPANFAPPRKSFSESYEPHPDHGLSHPTIEHTNRAERAQTLPPITPITP